MAVLRLIQGAQGAANTTRDAHEIVVGQSSAPYNDGVDDADFLDPGDGTGLEAALGAAAGRGHAVDVRLRECDLTLDPAQVALPLAIPDHVRLIGAGPAVAILSDTGSRIVGPDQDDQRMFTMGANAAIEQLAIVSPNPTAATSGANAGIIECTAGARFESVNIEITVDAPENEPRSQGDAIRSDSRDLAMTDVRITGDKQAAQQGGGAPLIRGVNVTDTAGSSQPMIVDRCRFEGIDQGIVVDTDGVYVAQSFFIDLASSSFRTTYAQGAGIGVALLGCFMQRDDVLYGPGVPKEVVDIDNTTGLIKDGGRIVGCEIDGTNSLGQGGGAIRLDASGGGAMRSATVEACVVHDFDFAVVIADALVESARVTGNSYRSITGGAFVSDAGTDTILTLDNLGNVALGGGATATLGTVGGDGPATETQNSWAEVELNGSRFFVPLWQ